MKTLASNMLNKASTMLQETKSNVLGSMSKAKSMSPTKDLSEEQAATLEVNEDHNTKMSEDEKKRIMRMIEQEGSSDEEDVSDAEENSGEGDAVKEGKVGGNASDNDSFCSDNDIFNRSLQSDCGDAIKAENYLRYASEEYGRKLDILDIIDKNERSFKQVAEKMI